MKHTPGPWHIMKYSHSDKEIVIGEPAIFVDFDDVCQETQEANARLIAAAPDLLEALRPFAYLAEVMEEGQVLNFHGVYVTWEQADAARAAIAKAGQEATK